MLFLDFFHDALFTRDILRKFLNIVGNDLVLEFYYKRRKISSRKGLTRLESEEDIKEMIRVGDGLLLMQIYVIDQLH